MYIGAPYPQAPLGSVPSGASGLRTPRGLRAPYLQGPQGSVPPGASGLRTPRGLGAPYLQGPGAPYLQGPPGSVPPGASGLRTPRGLGAPYLQGPRGSVPPGASGLRTGCRDSPSLAWRTQSCSTASQLLCSSCEAAVKRRCRAYGCQSSRGNRPGPFREGGPPSRASVPRNKNTAQNIESTATLTC